MEGGWYPGGRPPCFPALGIQKLPASARMMRGILRVLANGLSDLWLDPGLREDVCCEGDPGLQGERKEGGEERWRREMEGRKKKRKRGEKEGREEGRQKGKERRKRRKEKNETREGEGKRGEGEKEGRRKGKRKMKQDREERGGRGRRLARGKEKRKRRRKEKNETREGGGRGKEPTDFLTE